jgi:hypothetical protein
VIAAIMQPYFFPYIGYFQLMHAVDVFVFHDDVQYIKSGWINRNRILVNEGPTWFTLSVESASYALPIHYRHYQLDGKTIVQRSVRRPASAFSGRNHVQTVCKLPVRPSYYEQGNRSFLPGWVLSTGNEVPGACGQHLPRLCQIEHVDL